MRLRVFTIISGILMVFLWSMLLMPQTGHSFWYGEQTLDAMGYSYSTCDSLAAINASLRREMRGFTNGSGGGQGILIDEPGSWDGYTLLSCVGGCRHDDAPDPTFYYPSLLVGPDGEFVHAWDDINNIPGKLIPGGYLMGGRGPGFGGDHLIIQDWCGEEVWAWEIPNGRWHHDHQIKNSASGAYSPSPGQQPKMNGNKKRLVLANHRPGMEYEYGKKEAVGGLSHPAESTDHISNIWSIEGVDDAIYEVDAKGRIKWQWFAHQHVDQMNFDTIARIAMNDFRVGRPPATDWSHFNNVNWLGPNPYSDDPRFHPDNIIFDSRTHGTVGIIAHDDNPGHWQKGDIVWQIGPGQHVYNTEGEDMGPIIGPHNAHFIPVGNPGWGDVIVFDNGGTSNYGALAEYDLPETDCVDNEVPFYPAALRDYSRILQIDPVTQEVVWYYENTAAPGFTDTHGNWNRKFFSTFISGVQRTPLGTTIITEGNQARIFEVNMDGQIIWEYHPDARRGGPGVIGNAVYRSYRYPESYLPEDWESMTCE